MRAEGVQHRAVEVALEGHDALDQVVRLDPGPARGTPGASVAMPISAVVAEEAHQEPALLLAAEPALPELRHQVVRQVVGDPVRRLGEDLDRRRRDAGLLDQLAQRRRRAAPRPRRCRPAASARRARDCRSAARRRPAPPGSAPSARRRAGRAARRISASVTGSAAARRRGRTCRAGCRSRRRAGSPRPAAARSPPCAAGPPRGSSSRPRSASRSRASRAGRPPSAGRRRRRLLGLGRPPRAARCSTMMSGATPSAWIERPDGV